MTRSREIRNKAWALVPAKAPGRAKMRLSPLLSSEERSALQRAMLADVLGALSRARRIAGVAVISPDPELAAIASRHGATFIAEDPAAGDLNTSIDTGAETLRRAGATLIAIIPADVPLVEPADIDRAIAQAERTGATVVVPDRHRDGTNALVFAADARPRFAYGPDSYRRHLATAAGRPAIPLPLASLALDIDTPDDLADLAAAVAQGRAPETRTAMAAIECRHQIPALEEDQQ
jgi:2-phospho-L-lactate guanylyltransferase